MQISPYVLPATGPVGAGGDQARDFETFFTLQDSHVWGGQVVGMCTLQTDKLPEKIKDELRRVAAGATADLVYVFSEADIPVGTRHKLADFARNRCGITLEILDGTGLSAQLAAPNLVGIASRYLSLPPEVLSRGGLETAEAHEWAREHPGFAKPELHRYLQAVERVTRTHPYPFAAGLSCAQVPALTEIYMPQDVVDIAPPDAGSSSPANTPTASGWTDLLEHHRHLLVYGGPGAGKSSLLRHIAGSLALDCLASGSEGSFPVLIHARHLAASMPVADAIQEGAIRELGGELSRGLPQGSFEAAPLPGRPWLVLVDGLDEIRDPAARNNALRALATGCTEPAWRFVVATRPLPTGDLKSLRKHFGECRLRPFTKDMLRKFAGRWLSRPARPGSPVVADQVDERVRLIIDYGRLPRTPLVAAMLCTLATNAPSDPLPAGRASLYAQLTDLLQSRASPAAEPGLHALHEQRLAMLEDVAYQRHVEGAEGTVLNLALAWAGCHDLHPAPGMGSRWIRIVHDALCETGLVVSENNDLEYSHSTFEEFLAARHCHRMFAQSSGLHPWQEMMNRLIESISYCYGSLGNFIPLSQFFQFLVGLLALAEYDTDTFVAQMLESRPQVSTIIAELAMDGVPLGTKVTAALTRIAADWTEEPQDSDMV